MKKAIISIFYLTVLPTFIFAQKGDAPSCPEPGHYVVSRTQVPPIIDGDVSDQAWNQAPWSNYFSDIEGDKKPTPRYKTRMKMLWDDQYLYIAAELEEPHVWATLKQRDEIIFHDNDFEVFIDPDGDALNYFEIEINALNTIFDLFMGKTYKNGGKALFSWDAPGMRTAVKVMGTINNPSDVDRGWNIEMAIPFRAVSVGNEVIAPREGTTWRINFSRVEWNTEIIDGKYVKKKDVNGKNLPENNWVWSPQGVVDMHRPECWGYIRFTEKKQ